MQIRAAVAIGAIFLVVGSAAAAPSAEKLLAKSSTARTFDSVSRTVYLRDDPDYRRALADARADLAEAQAELREAQEAIAQVGELTPAQKRAQDEFLRPFREAVRAAKARLADVQGDWLRPFRAYGFKVQTSPSGQPVEVEWTVSCHRGERETRHQGTTRSRAPVALWRAPTVARAHRCRVSASALRDQENGRMVVSLVGRR
jgi:hypothetical protein